MAGASRNPYVGPRTFEEGDKDVFFGRDREARELLSLVISNRLVLFYAQSGAGKSSLVNTRLRPGLQKEGFELLPVCRVSGELPEEIEQDIESVANIFVFSVLLNLHNDQRTAATLAEVSLAHGLEIHKEKTQVLRDDEDEPARVLILDQFEEIMTTHLAHWAERADFFRQLKVALEADPLLWVVLVMREDYVGALGPYGRLVPGRFRARMSMQRMGAEAALEAVKRPAENFALPFAPGAAEKLVDNLRQIRVPGRSGPQVGEFVEPVHLQVVCYQLWENLQSTAEAPREISEADLETFGNVDSALAQFYEHAIARTAAETGCPELTLHNWFREQLITEARTRSTVYRGKEQTGGLDNEVVNALTRRFLLRAEIRAGGKWYELVHDRFIEPILGATRDWWARQGSLTQAARKWKESGRNQTYLFLGEQLREARERSAPRALAPLVIDFLDASAEADRELAGQLEVVRQLERRGKWLAMAAGVVLLTYLPFLGGYIIGAVIWGEWAALFGILVIFILIGIGALLGWLVYRAVHGRKIARRRLQILTSKLEAEDWQPATETPTGKWKIGSPELTLQLAPLWVFVAVAGIDGKMDRRELAALIRGVKKGGRRGAPLVREILRPVADNFDQVLKKFGDDDRNVATGLKDVAKFLDQKADPEGVKRFKKRIHRIGRQVARASGLGPFLLVPFGRTSEKEKEALADVARHLGMPW